MHKYKPVIWVVIFMIIVGSPEFTYFFLGQYVDTENYENRSAALRPTLTLKNYELFPKEYETYYNDNIPFRNQLIRLNSSIDYFIFKQSSNKNVVIGDDGWLFYCNNDDANPVRQSLGYWYFTDEQLCAIADNLIEIEETLNSQGIEFTLFIAPNKETIYIDRLPDYYKKENLYTSTDQLVDYLKENTNIRVIYPKKELLAVMEKNADIFLYHKLDTHWNYAGAYIGARSLAKELNIEMPSLDEISLQTIVSSSGDLTNMLNIQIKNGDIDYDISGISSLNTENEKWDFLTEFIYHTAGADPRKLFVRRDSYASALAPSLATQFTDSMWIYKDKFDWKQVFDYGTDIFVLETVERYESELIDFRIDYLAEGGENIQGLEFKGNIQIPISENNEDYKNLIASGFYDVEKANGSPAVWTNGDSSCFTVKFEQGYIKDFRMVLDVVTTVGGSQQDVVAYINGKKLDNVTITQDKIYLDIPNSYIENETLNIRLYYPNAYSPVEKGENADTRKLAFLIKGISCEEYEIN